MEVVGATCRAMRTASRIEALSATSSSLTTAPGNVTRSEGATAVASTLARASSFESNESSAPRNTTPTVPRDRARRRGGW